MSTQSNALTLSELEEIYSEIDGQQSYHQWRATADKEMDYADGNQLDTDLLLKQKELQIPPAMEDIIGPKLRAIAGYEISTRTDWRVTADGQVGGQDVADALSYRLNQAERNSRADQALSDALRAQIACGLGWIEVSREQDPFRFPYRCRVVSRNEIYWDTTSEEAYDLSDARWLIRQRWLWPSQVACRFPKHKDLIERVGKQGPYWFGATPSDGGQSTGLQNAWAAGRASTIQEARWYDGYNKQTCLSEIWYRRWVSSSILRFRDGRVVEHDPDNPAHVAAVMTGFAKLSEATVSRVRRAYWLGPYQLYDGPSIYTHRFFPYVPVWGFREDTTGVPYGLVRGMKYPQDAINSITSKLRWGMSAYRLRYTKGATSMSPAQLREQAGRMNGIFELNADHMARPGALFEISHDYAITDQHFRLLEDSRASIERSSGITQGFQGARGSASSGLQESIQVEQSNQGIADLMDNFRSARTQVGELLLAMIVEEIGKEQTEVVIDGDAIRDERTIVLNKPELDEDGYPYLSNDLQRIRLKVSLDDVPSTQSFRAQQLNSISEVVKSLPPQYQAVLTPFVFALTDSPFKQEMIDALRKVQEFGSPEEVEKRIRSEIANELKGREIELKADKTQAEIKEIEARAVQIGVQAAFSAMQAGAQIAQAPVIAPLADVVMQTAGYQPPAPPGVDPNFATPQQIADAQGGAPGALESTGLPVVRQNTSPTYPPVPQSAMTGIETPDIDDNLP